MGAGAFSDPQLPFKVAEIAFKHLSHNIAFTTPGRKSDTFHTHPKLFRQPNGDGTFKSSCHVTIVYIVDTKNSPRLSGCAQRRGPPVFVHCRVSDANHGVSWADPGNKSTVSEMAETAGFEPARDLSSQPA